jgi:predicted nucleic acid-binding protein
MQQVVEFKRRGQTEGPKQTPPLAFLDTSVILGYLRGEQSAVQLFSAESDGRVRFAINPIVLQELLLTEGAVARPEFERIRDHLTVLPIDFSKAEALAAEAARALEGMPPAPSLRKRLAHSNDLIILSSVGDCDFLVTRDKVLGNLVTDDKPQVVTPRQLVARLRAA